MSPPEALIWQQVRGSQLGFKVRRQHPIGPYVADFYVREAKLAVEVDGAPHDFGNGPERDLVRDQYMREQGYRLLRIPAREVLEGLEPVLTAIVEQVTNPLHHPSPTASDGPPPRAGEDL
jgi:very-short-patch-repair endonuclease